MLCIGRVAGSCDNEINTPIVVRIYSPVTIVVGPHLFMEMDTCFPLFAISVYHMVHSIGLRDREQEASRGQMQN